MIFPTILSKDYTILERSKWHEAACRGDWSSSLTAYYSKFQPLLFYRPIQCSKPGPTSFRLTRKHTNFHGNRQRLNSLRAANVSSKETYYLTTLYCWYNIKQHNAPFLKYLYRSCTRSPNPEGWISWTVSTTKTTRKEHVWTSNAQKKESELDCVCNFLSMLNFCWLQSIFSSAFSPWSSFWNIQCCNDDSVPCHVH